MEPDRFFCPIKRVEFRKEKEKRTVHNEVLQEDASQVYHFLQEHYSSDLGLRTDGFIHL